MRTTVALLLNVLIIVFCNSSGATPTVLEYSSMDDLYNHGASTSAAHVAAYYCSPGSCATTVFPDGGEGLFVANGNGCAASDGGYILKDINGVCWYRQNINGDLRQFGATEGSVYDCKGSRIDGTSGHCTAADTILARAQDAAETAGVHRLTTSGVQIRLANTSTFTLDDHMTLDGGVGSPDVSNHNINDPGTIWTSDTAQTAITLGNGSSLENIALMPYWIGKNLYDWYQSNTEITYLNQEAIIDHMTSNGQEGVSCSGQSCVVRNATVAGYDTAIDVSGGGASTLEDIQGDGDVCVYVHGASSATHFGRVDCNTYATKDGPTSESFSITNVQSNSGACQVFVSPTSPHFSDISSSNYVWVSGLDATTGANANGRWYPSGISVIAGGITLGGSACAASGGTLNGPTVTGASYVAGTYVISLPSTTAATDIANIAVGQTVTGPGTEIQSGTVVKSVGRSMPCSPPGTSGICVMIGINKPINTSDSSASITFSSTHGGTYPACVINGIDGSTGACLIITAQERIDVGASAGGQAAMGGGSYTGCATAFLVGGFNSTSTPDANCQTGKGATEKVSGFDLESPFCFGYAICFHLANAYNARILSPGMDATRNLSDEDTAFGMVDGSFKGLSFIGGKAGKVGSGLIINPSGTDKGCVNVESQNLSNFEIDQGCLLGRGLDSANDLMVSDSAVAVQATGYSPNLSVYPQDFTSDHYASTVIDTSGVLQTKVGSRWWGGQFTPGGVAPTLTGTGTGGPSVATGNDSVGRFTLGTATLGLTLTLTFSHAWSNTPVCRIWDQANTTSMVPTVLTTTYFQVTLGNIPSHTVAYQCTGYSN
jgi:hypothetical protein